MIVKILSLIIKLCVLVAPCASSRYITDRYVKFMLCKSRYPAFGTYAINSTFNLTAYRIKQTPKLLLWSWSILF